MLLLQLFVLLQSIYYVKSEFSPYLFYCQYHRIEMNPLGFKIRERKRVEAPPPEEVVYLELNDAVIELLSVKDPTPISQHHGKLVIE